MELKEGMYVRTKDGRISKVMRIKRDIELNLKFYCFEENIIHINYEECELGRIISKASNNIIDLIEVGDYVNGFKVESVYSPTGDEVLWIKLSCNPIDNWKNEDIKSIVTKECFESMEYKVNE